MSSLVWERHRIFFPCFSHLISKVKREKLVVVVVVVVVVVFANTFKG